MKSKPIVMERLYYENESFIVDLILPVNIVILTGEAGTGKSLLYRLIRQMKEATENIICINYEEYNQNISQLIEDNIGKLVVIDNADILLDNKTRKTISLDACNQYILIGRNPGNLFTTTENIYELITEKYQNKIRFSVEAILTKKGAWGR